MSKVYSCILAAVLAVPAVAQEATAAKSHSVSVKLSGTVDAYYGLNLGQSQTVTNTVRAYDGEPGLQFDYAEASIAVDPAPAGLRLDVAFGGQEMEASLGDSALAFTNLLVVQGYVTLKLGPTILDAGRFVTPAGFEKHAARDNWLYTRGLLYRYAIPRSHEGVRLTVPLDGGVTLAGYFSNGSDLQANDTGEPPSPHKTAIVSARYQKDQTDAAVNVFYTKPVGLDDNGFLADFVVTQGFGDAALNVSADYGKVSTAEWYGAGVQGKYTLRDPNLRFAGRFEWLNDKDGVRGAVGGVPVGPAKYWDLTVGIAYPVGQNAELRGEFRYDHASNAAMVFPGEHSGSTATLAAVAWF